MGVSTYEYTRAYMCARIFLTMPFSPALLCFNEDSRGSNLVRHVNVNVGQEPPSDSQLSYRDACLAADRAASAPVRITGEDTR